MTPEQFIAKWQHITLKERSAAQEHFIDLCRLLGEPTPAEADPTGEWYCFEKGGKKASGMQGFSDVWKRAYFGWEYKGPGGDLRKAFAQLQTYSPLLEYPPLLIVSDLQRIEIHTAFMGMVPVTYVIELEDLRHIAKRELLKWAFSDPERLRPKQTTAALTEQAVQPLAELAQALKRRGHDPHSVAHFSQQLLFCLFAEAIGLLPHKLFTRLLEAAKKHLNQAAQMLESLFNAMANGGLFGLDPVDWFNGDLFANAQALPLEWEDVHTLRKLADLDWSAIEPAIFGTLFERGLDPDKRSQLGAHYTDRNAILRLIHPVLRDPLLAEWEQVKLRIQADHSKRQTKALSAYNGFLERLRNTRVLDPACGSGNFLYLALQTLKDLEHQVILEAELLGLPRQFPMVGPETVHGLEINRYAAELARVTVWIGEIQWMIQHGYDLNRKPILKALNTIEQCDAILDENGQEPEWPTAEMIVGNPPFLGDKKMLRELGNDYVSQLRACYKGRVPGGADLVCYWFEKARVQLAQMKCQRVGLVATNSVRGGANRKVLERITENGKIFNAWSDEEWVNEGAAVRVSLICFGNSDVPSVLNGKPVPTIHADLTSNAESVDLTRAKQLKENAGIAFIGTQKSGNFDIPGALARQWLKLPNPHGKPNSDVLRPWANGMDITRRFSDTWIIDFGINMTEADAALFEMPFQYVQTKIKHLRTGNREGRANEKWWLHQRSRPDLRAALIGLPRYIITPRVSKYRLFVWLPVLILPDSATVAIARTDDTTFGVLHSHFHEWWSLRMGTSLGATPRYTPTTTFETFPFPAGVLNDPNPDVRFLAIAEAVRRLNELRENWLNPPEWTQRLPEIVAGYPERIIAKPGYENELKQRTLTNLYNQRPAWLINAHKNLDKAVAEAYGWSDYNPNLPESEILRRLLALNQQRANNVN